MTRCSPTASSTPATWTFRTIGVAGTSFPGVRFDGVFITRCEIFEYLAGGGKTISTAVFITATAGTGGARSFLRGQTIKQVVGKPPLVAFKDGRRFHGPLFPSRAFFAGWSITAFATSTWPILAAGCGFRGWDRVLSRTAIPSSRGLFTARAIPTGSVIAGAIFPGPFRSRAIFSCGASGRWLRLTASRSRVAACFYRSGVTTGSLISVGASTIAAGLLISSRAFRSGSLSGSITAGSISRSATIGTVAAGTRSAIPFVRGLPVPAFQSVPEVVLLMSGLRLRGLGIYGLLGLFQIRIIQIRVVETGVLHHGLRGTPNRLRTNVLDNVIVIIRDVAVGWGALLGFRPFFFVLVVKCVEQAHAEPFVVIVTRNLQPRHRLTWWGRGSCRSSFSNGGFVRRL